MRSIDKRCCRKVLALWIPGSRVLSNFLLHLTNVLFKAKRTTFPFHHAGETTSSFSSQSLSYTLPATAKNSFVAKILHVPENCISFQIETNNLQQPKRYATQSTYLCVLCVFVGRRINKSLNEPSFQQE